MEEIESESKLILKIILHILMIPINLVLILFGKREFKDLLQPFYDIARFVFQPKFTISIIIIDIIIFFVSSSLGEDFVLRFVNYPQDLIKFRFYTLFTAGFLHANLPHLLGNIVGIFIFGRVVERRLGIGKTMFIYFGAMVKAGIFASLIHLFILKDNTGGLGASGALMGLVAAAMLLNPFYITYELLIPLPIMIVGWLTLIGDISGILNPTEDGIGHFAHLGGFFSITTTMFIFGFEDRAKLKRGFIINILTLIAIILAYIYLSSATLNLGPLSQHSFRSPLQPFY